LRRYVIIWTYEDQIGHLSGKLEVEANSRKEAEGNFYKLNKPLITKERNMIVMGEEGYVCECVLTYREWVNEGRPEKI
jgi:hypothetical protein